MGTCRGRGVRALRRGTRRAPATRRVHRPAALALRGHCRGAVSAALVLPYLQLYRKQVVKQADLVLALFLRGDAFTDEEKARDFEYYERVTVRDSSLSACCQAIIAAEVGLPDLAHQYIIESALADIRDAEHDSSDGLHVAALAGTWLALVCGFGGLRQVDDGLSFRPVL